MRHVQNRAQKRTKKRKAKAKVRKAAAAARKPAKPEQLVFVDNRDASKRRFPSGKKIGRPLEKGAGQRHGSRPKLNPRFPLHVNTRICAGLETLRTNEAVDLICGAIRETQEKYGMRLIAYSIQSTHLHFIVEVDGSELQASLAGVHVNDILTREELAKRALAKSMKSLLGKVAKRLNKLWRREGKVFDERYHAVVIKSPLQMKRTLEYVLNNGFQHGSTNLRIDPYSSGRYFDGWEEAIELPNEPREDWPVVPPRTWLAREGWKRHGPIRFPVAG